MKKVWVKNIQENDKFCQQPQISKLTQTLLHIRRMQLLYVRIKVNTECDREIYLNGGHRHKR
jgi:hypothetical protein